jgi:hypothetical protein
MNITGLHALEATGYADSLGYGLSGHVRTVMCRAHRKTVALLKPVMKPPSPPRIAQMATTTALIFCKRVSIRR